MHRTPKKPKSKRQLAAEASTSTAVQQEGTRDSPIALLSDNDEERTGHKRKRYLTIVEGGKKRKVVDVVRRIYPFSLFGLFVIFSLAWLPS
jgi:hypothetical protein